MHVSNISSLEEVILCAVRRTDCHLTVFYILSRIPLFFSIEGQQTLGG